MKMLEPVDDLPSTSKYSELLRQATALGGRWLPVEFESAAEARRLSQTASEGITHKRPIWAPFQVARRGNTVFIRLKP